MAVRPVHVAVLDLFLARRANLELLAAQLYRALGERVVAVEGRLGVAERGDAEHLALPFLVGLAVQRRAEHHALRQPLARLATDERRVVLAEAVARRERDARLAARLQPGQRRLELREQVAVAAVQVLDLVRGPGRAALDHFDGHAYHGIFGDLHAASSAAPSRSR